MPNLSSLSEGRRKEGGGRDTRLLESVGKGGEGTGCPKLTKKLADVLALNLCS